MNRIQLAIGLCVASVMVGSILSVNRARDDTLRSSERATPSVVSLAPRPNRVQRGWSNPPSAIRAAHRQLGRKSTVVAAAGPKRATFLMWRTCFDATWLPVPFDEEGAKVYGRMFAAVRASGQTSPSRFADLLIAATAAANDLPLYSRNPDDFRALQCIVKVIAI